MFGKRVGFWVVMLTVYAVTLAQNTPQIKVDVQMVTLDFYVDDAAERPVLTLNREDFTVLEDGKPREIQSFDSATSPYNILLLFDRSISTRDQWLFLTHAIDRFIRQLPDQHRVALAAFDEKPEMLLGWRDRREFLRQVVNLGENGAGSSVYRSLEWATDQLKAVRGRKGMIVFTDGVDNLLSRKLVSFDKNGTPSIASPENDSEFQKMLRAVVQGKAPVYFVGVNTDLNPDPKAPPNAFDTLQHTAARLRMQIVADRSYGALHLPNDLDEVIRLYDRIGQVLGNAYTVGFAPASTARDGSHHRIQVLTRDSTLRVTASREGYDAR